MGLELEQCHLKPHLPSLPSGELPPTPLPSLFPASPQVRDWIVEIGVENMGKRLVNSREGKVEFSKPMMSLATLMKYGNLIVQEQENVKRVQLADEYMSSAALAGKSGSSMPEAYAMS